MPQVCMTITGGCAFDGGLILTMLPLPLPLPLALVLALALAVAGYAYSIIRQHQSEIS